MAGTASASRCTRRLCGSGTTNWVMAMASSARKTISQKMPCTPVKLATIGPATRATMNERPMVTPTMAIALVRFSSLVRSATSARITEPAAPDPCSSRPRITPSIEVETAATALPIAKSASPVTIKTLRPILSERTPKGICRSAWLRP